MNQTVNPTATRLESDSIGEKAVPAEAYYGVQSLRAMENFFITGQLLRPEMIDSLALLKKACASANKEAGALEARVADAIMGACDDILIIPLTDLHRLAYPMK